MGEVKDFPIVCSDCGQELNEGDLFYHHPKYGIVCEHCPAFSDGGISIKSDEGGEHE